MTKHWDANAYVPASNLQQRLAKLVLQQPNPIAATDYILDLGCGPGNITAELATTHVKQGNILGIDATESMISHAKATYKQIDNLNFQLLNANDLSFQNLFDGAVSFTMLHWIEDQASVLQKVYNALKPQGYFFGYFFPFASYVHMPLAFVMQRQSWKKHFAEFKQDYYYHDIDGYKFLLQQTGFKIIDISAPILPLVWDRELFIKTQSSWLPQLSYIPKQQHDLFLNELADEFARFHPKLEDGTYLGPLRIIIFSAKK
ncbi:MAG: methyltransferase domain-containing protein [Pseudomonadota bacterium]